MLLIAGKTFVLAFALALVLTPVVRVVARRRTEGTPVLVYGAAASGAIPLRELMSNPEHGVRPVGLIDDDPAMLRQRILGLPVLGSVELLDDILMRTGAQQVIVSDVAIGADTLDRLSRTCAARGVSARRMRFVIDQP
ncbi:MAG: hypothetical protein IMZ67_00245 [Acidobacteria bacterium]|nr:hypothetical protein [Acidobacteriota bacterium]